MTRDEFGNLVKAMRTMWPHDQKSLTTKEGYEIWYAALGDIAYDVVSVALQKRFATVESPWYPTPAEIRKMSAELVTEPKADYTQAWEIAQKAVRRYGYMNEAEALQSMPEAVRTAVERIGYQKLCSYDIADEMATRAQFRDIYNRVVDAKKENNLIPLEMRERIERIRAEAIPRITEEEKPGIEFTKDPVYVPGGSVESVRKMLGNESRVNRC